MSNVNDEQWHGQNDANNPIASTPEAVGFEPLNANYVYCPNQFFDVCLKSNSRGMVRIVAYVLRQTLGWLDEHGQPVHNTVKVSYRDLVEKAGVSRGAIGPALQRAVQEGFIECHVPGIPNSNNQAGQAAKYTLRWDTSNAFTKLPSDFDGFYAGEGHRTPVPNSFFDMVIPSQTLAVTKVVGTVIRHTIGYQNQFGGRRNSAPLSFTYIQNYSKKRAAWYIGYTDENGKRRTCKGFTDKGETEQLAAKLEYEVMLRKRGVIDVEKLEAAEKRKMPIGIHVDDYKKHLERNGQNTEKHVKLTIGRIEKVIAQGKFQSIACVSPDKLESAVGDLRRTRGLGAKTYNHYLQAMDSFGNWLFNTRRALSNPFRGIERMNTEVDIRHKRRALRPEEFRKLVESARSSQVSIQCYDGETRAQIYLISYFTGLRRKEIASLTPSSFRLDETLPVLHVEAACSKHRKFDVLPLHPELVSMLRGWLEGKEPNAPLFPKLAKRRTWLMVKKDLERAGIPYETSEGIADFHASGRHTYITELLRSGASLAETKELARHGDVKMTMKYAHIGLEDQGRALARLGWERPGSVSGGSNGHSVTTEDNTRDDPLPQKNEMPR